MRAKLKIDKGFDPAIVRQSPLVLLDKFSATMDIILSDELFAIFAKQPQAMLILLLIPPKDLGDQKQYLLQLHHGKLLLNGSPLL